MKLAVAGKSRIKITFRVMVALLVASIISIASAGVQAFAHAVVVETTPSDGEVLSDSPSSANLLFNEPVKLIDGAIRLFPNDAEPITLSAHTVNHSVEIELPTSLPIGSYTLSYRVVSADGHPIGGALTFHLGEPSTAQAKTTLAGQAQETPTATEVAVTLFTALQYLGFLIFTGLALFTAFVLPRSREPLLQIQRLSRLALWVGVVASALLIPLAALRIVGASPSEILNIEIWLPGLQPGSVLIFAASITAGTLASIFSIRAPVVASVFASVVVVSPSLVGHSQTTNPIWLTMASDIVHLFAAAFWAGGLIGLIIYIFYERPNRSGRMTDPSGAVQVTIQFSRLALYSVLALALSGGLMGLLILDSPAKLWQTGYGLSLLLKLCLVLAVMLLAVYNRFALIPRIKSKASSDLGWSEFIKILKNEAALLIAIILFTAYLTNTSPNHNHSENSPGASITETRLFANSQGLTVDGELFPAKTGINTFNFSLEFNGGRISTSEIFVSARLPLEDIGPIAAETVFDPVTGNYNSTLMLPVTGEWLLQVSARISAFEHPIAVLEAII